MKERANEWNEYGTEGKQGTLQMGSVPKRMNIVNSRFSYFRLSDTALYPTLLFIRHCPLSDSVLYPTLQIIRHCPLSDIALYQTLPVI